VGPRAGLDDVEKRNFLTLPGLELRPLGRPARSQSLYRLRYLAPNFSFYINIDPKKTKILYFYLINCYVRYVDIIDGRKLKITKWGGIYWHDVHNKFHGILSTGSKFRRIKRGQML
jgi:hypothetical protein